PPDKLTDAVPAASAPAAAAVAALRVRALRRAQASLRSVVAEARPAGSRSQAAASRGAGQGWAPANAAEEPPWADADADALALRDAADLARRFRALQAAAMRPLTAEEAAARLVAARHVRSHPACVFRGRSCGPQARTTARSRRRCG